MTFIPDPTVLNCGDTVFLKRELVVRGYGRFTKGHEFKVKALPLRINDTNILLRDADGHNATVSPHDVTRIRP